MLPSGKGSDPLALDTQLLWLMDVGNKLIEYLYQILFWRTISCVCFH